MDVYETLTLGKRIEGNPYVGRGIAVGKTADGKHAAAAYFIMGRSENSRNRVFREEDGKIITAPFDESKVTDPSLIIYSAVRRYNSSLIVTNGDQTDTVYDYLSQGKTFAEALDTREFEPDAPNYTPRISAVLDFAGDGFSYQMSILKSADAGGSACSRYLFSYPAIDGTGHFIHTYVTDGNPIPTFMGEPERIAVPNSIDEFTDDIWSNLDEDNRISLYTVYADINTGRTAETRIINKKR